MRMLVLLGLIIVLTCNLSCVEEKSFKNVGVNSDLKEEYQNLSMNLEDLNRKYIYDSRGVDWKTSALILSTVSTDVTGWNYGRKFGVIAGGFIGGFGGIVPGYYVGGLLGGAVSSAIIYLGNKDIISPNDVYSTVVSVDFSDNFADTLKIDSLGYYHNLIINELYRDKEKFLKTDLSVDINAVVKEVNNLCNVYGFCENKLNSKEISNMIDFNFRLDSINQLYLTHSIDEDSLFSSSIRLLEDFVSLNENDYYEYNLINSKIVSACAVMDPSKLSRYAEDLKEIVSKSNLPIVKKNDLIVTGVFVVNSAQCTSVKMPLP